MNGSVAGGGVSEEVIRLTRGPSGLGFNIVGGTDQQVDSNDSSIYVSRIKKDGPAHLDGRLQEGDKILAINGRDLKNLRHMDAVELFKNAGYDVSLKIQHRISFLRGKGLPVKAESQLLQFAFRGQNLTGDKTFLFQRSSLTLVVRCV
uniref:Synaptojanin-2-binding protein n=1 Tax=Gallus gallus TaxID=9031 RepID=A0A8V0ZCF9_CHICK